MKRTIKLFCFLLLITLTSVYAQKEIAGVTPEKTIQIDGNLLQYNGAGLREKFFLDLYVGTLYLGHPSQDPERIIAADEPMAITLDIISGLITSEKMIASTDEGFEKSTKGNTQALAKEIKIFKEAFKEKIQDKDDFMIAYVPAKGIQVYKNGSLITTIPGLAFKKAVFGIWLSDDPADKELKKAMLGQ